MKTCAKCGAEVSDDALWCPACGADVGRNLPEPEPERAVVDSDSDVVVVDESEAVVMAPKKAFCPSCGKPVDSNASFCASCGSQLKGQPAQPVQKVVVVEKHVERERPRRPLYIPPKREENVLGMVSFILTMVGLFGFLFTSWFGIGFICVFLWPITLILSFIALFKRPRAFAIAAFVISLFECLGMLVAIIFFGALIGALFSY